MNITLKCGCGACLTINNLEPVSDFRADTIIMAKAAMASFEERHKACVKKSTPGPGTIRTASELAACIVVFPENEKCIICKTNDDKKWFRLPSTGWRPANELRYQFIHQHCFDNGTLYLHENSGSIRWQQADEPMPS